MRLRSLARMLHPIVNTFAISSHLPSITTRLEIASPLHSLVHSSSVSTSAFDSLPPFTLALEPFKMPSATGQNWEKFQKTFADDEEPEKKITPLTDE